VRNVVVAAQHVLPRLALQLLEAQALHGGHATVPGGGRLRVDLRVGLSAAALEVQVQLRGVDEPHRDLGVHVTQVRVAADAAVVVAGKDAHGRGVAIDGEGAQDEGVRDGEVRVVLEAH